MIGPVCRLPVSARAVIALTLVATPSAFAHHSGIEYDQSTLVELEGTAQTVHWRNPHILIELATTDENGQEVVWQLEGAALSNQRRRGVMEGMLQEGDEVRVAGYASTRRPAHMTAEHILLPSGTELLVGFAREPHFSEDQVGGNAPPVTAAAEADPADSGIFRVWTRAGGYWPWYFAEPHEYELTAWAAAHVAEYDTFADNPLLDCTQPGMPSVMGNPYPMEFIDHGDTIELRFEEFDVVRTIHMNDARDPADVPLSPLGHSVGRWDGDMLVVTTNRINWPYYGRMGLPQSESVHVTERFTLVADENRIDYEITNRDPEVFAGTQTWEAPYVWRPGEEVGVYACTVE